MAKPAPHTRFLTVPEIRHPPAGALRPVAGGAWGPSRDGDDEPLLPPHRHHAQKKTFIAREQDRADIKRRRRRWRSHQKHVDPSRLVFIDETPAFAGAGF